MTSHPTRNEMKADLAATKRDIVRLSRIAKDLRDFMTDSHGEDRTRTCKMDIFKYEGLLDKARKLETAIEKALDGRGS